MWQSGKILRIVKRFQSTINIFAAKIDEREISSLNVCEDLMRQSTNNNNKICCVFIKDNKDEAIIVCLSTIPIRPENIDKMIKLCKEQGISTMHIPREYF